MCCCRDCSVLKEFREWLLDLDKFFGSGSSTYGDREFGNRPEVIEKIVKSSLWKLDQLEIKSKGFITALPNWGWF